MEQERSNDYPLGGQIDEYDIQREKDLPHQHIWSAEVKTNDGEAIRWCMECDAVINSDGGIIG